MLIRRDELLGLAGSLLLAASAWLASPWGLGFASRENPVGVTVVQTVPAVLGLGALFLAWVGIRDADRRTAWRAFTLWSVPLVLAPALLSKDAWAYLDQGWIVAQGFDPYSTGLATIGGPFADRVDSYWQGTTPVYPAGALLVQAGVVVASGADPFWSLMAMRLPALTSVVVIGTLVPRIAELTGHGADRARWGSLLNPLVIVYFVGGMHNDAWALALAVTGVWLAARWRSAIAWLAAAALVGLGMSVKQPVGLMAVAVAMLGIALPGGTPPRRAWREAIRPALWRVPVAVAVTLATFGAVSASTGWGLGWARGSGTPYSTGNPSLPRTVAATAALVTGRPLADCLAIVGPVFVLAGVGVMAWLGWRCGATRPVAFVAWALVVFAFATPSLQPWYVLWGGVLLGAVGHDSRIEGWAVAVVGGLFALSVCLETAGLPIPVGQGVAVVVVLLLRRWARDSMAARPDDEGYVSD
ncbi:hypothetical protein GCM10009785_05160 [Brooklawnia cerclae]|uniref:DUF2029 domain-containing protein n=1 Tax=Brooklawnia cerclae TaxID=349934 RepID=A0ABX0SBY4_9ACTN|nr:hypothetical protein [Brooklawnia cerclae]